MYVIKVNDLVKQYGEKKVVNGINLSVNKGHIFGFLGKNGAGKSTFINMLTGIIRPSSGSFEILDVDDLQIDMIKNKLGVLPDYSTFYNDLSSIEHLRYFSNIMGLKKSNEDLCNLLRKVGLDKDINTKVKKFSFGMKKKLGIAQAIINDPELIFLDEPTSGVDVDSVLNIHKLIKELSCEGKTVFFTSHNLDEVEKLCDEIAIMKDGVIVSKGSIEDLRRKYQSSINVKIKHSKLSMENQNSLKSIFESVGKNIEWNEEYTFITVNDEENIPVLTKALNGMNINVYRMEIDEPSLEEMFIKM